MLLNHRKVFIHSDVAFKGVTFEGISTRGLMQGENEILAVKERKIC